jgi:hypothetical protein
MHTRSPVLTPDHLISPLLSKELMTIWLQVEQQMSMRMDPINFVFKFMSFQVFLVVGSVRRVNTLSGEVKSRQGGKDELGV